MSEDRLEKALEAMKNEEIGPEQLADVQARVRAKLELPSSVLCAEFQSEIQAYLDGSLEEKRRLLIEDHLGRCPSCRACMAGQKGERKAVPMPVRRAFRLPKWSAWAAAAAVLFGMLYVGRDGIYTLLTPAGKRATVVSETGGLYLVPVGLLKTGSTINDSSVIRTGPDSRAKLRLLDGSIIDMNERTELSIHTAWSGKTVHLQRGDIIVHAAKQRLGYLRVRTRDSVASVKGTIFAVSAGISGTLVSVVEGSVAVAQPGTETVLKPGEQAASNPTLAKSVQSAVSWSPDAETYASMLASLMHVQKEIAETPSPLLGSESRLLQLTPANTIVYGAIPNPGGVANQAALLLEQQASQNPAFNQWWNSGASRGLKQLINGMRTYMPLLGDEIVYGIAEDTTKESVKPVPFFLTEVRPGKQAELAADLEDLRSRMGTKPFHYDLTDSLLVVSDSGTRLQWLLDHMGQGAATPFASEIAARYQAGTGGLLGMDIGSLMSSSPSGTAGAEFFRTQHLKHIFFERHSVTGLEENRMTVSFNGPRTGIASFLASSGSAGAAEYVSQDALAAAYASTREPQLMARELIAQLSRLDPNFQSNLAQTEGKLGISFANDLARAFGTEFAFELKGISISGPVWTMAALVNDSDILDGTIGRLVDFINSELAKTGEFSPIRIETESINGRTWKTLRFPKSQLTVTWTYDSGYMVAGSSRGVVTRAIETRNAGTPLIYSSEFQQRLPYLAEMHPPSFFWLNTGLVFQGLSGLAQNPLLKELVAERDPILVIFSGAREQIDVVSRTRISGLMMNLLLLQNQNRALLMQGNPGTVQ